MPDSPSNQHDAALDIAEVAAVEVLQGVAVHLMSAAAVKVGLAEDVEPDLAEARMLINALPRTGETN